MAICYIGKATKIFIFIVTLLVITALILGFRLLHHPVHSNSCSGQGQYSSSCFPDPNFTTPSGAGGGSSASPTPTLFSQPPPPDQTQNNPAPPDPIQNPTPPVVVPGAPAPGLSPPSSTTTPAPMHSQPRKYRF